MFFRAKNLLKKVLPDKLYRWLRKCYRKYIRKMLKRPAKFVLFSVIYPYIYRRHSRAPIDENKVIFIEPVNSFGDNFQLIYQKLISEYDFEIHIHLLRNGFLPQREYRARCREMLKDVATAKYVLIDEACNIFAKVKLREQTQIAQTWHACGAFKKFGFSSADQLFGVGPKEMKRYPYYRHCSFVTVSSPEIVPIYAEAMGLPEDKILPLGVSRTDMFFDKAFLTASHKKLKSVMPSSIGKKVILFAPTFRGHIASATTATEFSVEDFYNAFSDDYVLLLKHHPFVKERPEISDRFHSFAADLTETMSIEELLCVADICISDYSSLIFEYSLFERPMLFFNYDIDEYFDWRGFFYSYDDLTPGPAFQTNQDMIDYLRHINERFDKQEVIDFKNRFMASCDGHSTQRLMDRLFGENLDEHKKKDPSSTNPVLYYPESERDN